SPVISRSIRSITLASSRRVSLSTESMRSSTDVLVLCVLTCAFFVVFRVVDFVAMPRLLVTCDRARPPARPGDELPAECREAPSRREYGGGGLRQRWHENDDPRFVAGATPSLH